MDWGIGRAVSNGTKCLDVKKLTTKYLIIPF